ncbi:MAG: TRAP transporter small permease [Burkholderiaceae bacterium]
MSVGVGPRELARTWHRVECWVAILAFGLIALLLMLDVLGREVIGPMLHAMGFKVGAIGVPGAQRISVYALVVGSFCGVGIATATSSHLVPRVAFSWVPARWGPVLDRIADAFTGIFVLGVAWYGLEFVMASKSTGMRAPVLEWEVWPFQLAIPAGFVSAAVRYLLFAAWPGLKPPPPEFQE